MTGRERREQLLDVGRHLFAERGLEGTSIEEIAARADVSKPVVYEHFGGKEGLYAVVVDREVERFLAKAKTSWRSSRSPPSNCSATSRTTPTASGSWSGTRTPRRDRGPTPA
jgi:AcrR family transcriptional regulator